MTEKKTKILYCITKANWGGAQRYVYDLATSLPNDKYEVLVITGNSGALTNKLESANVKTLILGNLSREVNAWIDFLTILRLRKIFRTERPDIIHLNSSKMGALGAIAGKLARVPKIIFTGHGWAFNEDRNSWQKKIIYFVHWLTLTLADQTIMVSAKTKNQIAKSQKIRDKTAVIRNGIEEINFLTKEQARAEIQKKLSVDLQSEGRPWIGTISELHKNKGLKYLIEAINLLKLESDDPTTLPITIIIGEGEKREKLQKRIERYNLESDVFLIGQIDEAARYLKAFDIFTLTSITEALPYAILEAGQAGLPVIASAVGGIPEIIDDTKNGILIRPMEPEEIVKAITSFLKNPDEMALLGQKLAERIKKYFDKKKMIEETLSLYK
jgi:glycosyltransferase involved in cell wall biosynthesis